MILDPAAVAPRVRGWDELTRVMRDCFACPLSESRTRVVPGVFPPGARLLLVGEAPGRTEDEGGLPFIGRSGQLLDTLLAEVGLARADIAVLNTVKCRPPGNRNPLPDEIAACRPYLEAQLEYMRPDVIVTLGNFATQFMVGQPIGITKARGRTFRFRGATVVPTFHPAAALRGGSDNGVTRVDAIRQDLQRARAIVEEARARRTTTEAPTTSTDQLGLF